MLKTKKTYDLYFSLGEACSSSSTLRGSKLQYFSYPFDWLSGGAFDDRIKIVLSGFERFIDIADLEYNGNRKHPEPCDIYKNTYNKLVFHHDFPLGGTFKDTYRAAKSKYDRRIKRLLSDINSANKILILYMEIPFDSIEQPAEKDLVEAQEGLSDKFGKPIDILYISNDETLPEDDIKIEDINPNIRKVFMNYGNESKGREYNAVEKKVLKNYFKNYKLTLSLSNKLRLMSFAALRVKKLKKGIGLYFFPKIKNNILRIKTRVFGLRIDLCIGKIKE